VFIFCVNIHSSYFHHQSITLSTMLCWNATHYELAENGVDAWTRDVPCFLIAITAYTT